MNIKERLKWVMKDNDMNLKDFSCKSQIPYRTLQNYLLGERTIGIDAVIKIYTHIGVNIHWLLTGEGEMYQSGSPNVSIQEICEKLSELTEQQKQEILNRIKEIKDVDDLKAEIKKLKERLEAQ